MDFGTDPAPWELGCPAGCQTLYRCAEGSRSDSAAFFGGGDICVLSCLGILGYLTGDFPGEIGVWGDSATGDRSAWASFSFTSSSIADSIDVAESCDIRRLTLLVAERRLFPTPVKSLLSRIIVK